MARQTVLTYTVTPPARDELKRLSFLLREADQSLVRRYDRLFLELQLDDRFIAENEFWTAIVEHPLLINGPVGTSVSLPSRSRIASAMNRTACSATGEASGAAGLPLLPSPG